MQRNFWITSTLENAMKKMNKDDVVPRTLTIVVTFDSARPPEWIWTAHMRQAFQNEVLVTAIVEGDITKLAYEQDEE